MPKKPPTKKPAQKKKPTPAKSGAKAPSKPKLLSGGNPQIPKGDGPAPVEAYLDAMPGWKQDVGRRLDHLIVKAVPGVQKAVRWNSPFYGLPDRGWFLAFHCITRYIKVTFFKGAALTPIPPENSKLPDVRYFHIYEDGAFDEKQFTAWVKQASKLPGDNCF